MQNEFDFGMLGPLVVRRAGAVLDPGRRKQRLLLVRLLLADGRAVAAQTLCEELWSEQPGRAPGGAMASLHAHVSKVRAVLEPPHLRGRGTFEVLVTKPGGYALRVPSECRDTVRFERAVALAQRLLEQGRPSDVVREAERALGMWRGAALADAAHHLFAAHEAARLEELRQTTREIRATAMLLDGRIPQAVAAAQELTAQHPLRETGWDLLLHALYLAGRHPEALERYADLRRHLADELGLEPSPRLHALHEGILRHDLPPLPLPLPGKAMAAGPAADTGDSRDPRRPEGGEAGEDQPEVTEAPDGTAPLGTHPVVAVPGATSCEPTGDATHSGTSCEPTADPTRSGTPAGSVDPSDAHDDPAAGGAMSGSPRVARPAQLPGDLAVFAGRAAEGAWLSAARGAPGRPGPAGAPVVVICGAPGVGKTTFAVHHAHHIASSFPDGQLFVNLCGFHPHAPAVEPGDALHGFLTALGVPAPHIPEDTTARSTLFRSLLADRRVLVVLDNARDEQQVRPLLPAGTGCLTLVTSRNQLPGLIATDAARPLSLPLPSRSEAHETLARRLGPERLAAEPAAAAEIIRLCGRLPLALAVVAARAELDPAFPLQAIADDLRDAHGGLDAFTGFDTATDVRTVFSWSYRSLDEPAARLFRLLALHPGPHITAPAAAGLAGLPLPRTRRLLARLTRSCLVEQPLPGRFTLHDLLRVYATELTQTHDDADERHRATLRVLDHYMFTAYEANRLFRQDSLPQLDLGSPNPGVTPEDLTTAEQANRWLTAEHRVLSALLHTAVSQELDRHVTGLAWSLKEHLNRQEYWPEAIAALGPALEVARRRGDRLEEGRCLRHIGSIHGYLGHQEQALRHLRHATTLLEELDAVAEQARAHYGTACALYLFGRIPEAVASSERGLALSRATGDELWTAECLNELAWFYSNLGQLEKSLVHSEEALALFARLDAPWQQAQSWDCLGYTLRMLGRYEESVATYRRAMEAFEELGDHRNAVGALMRLGDTRLAMGDREAARSHWVRALGSAEQRALSYSAQEVRDRLAALDTDADPAPTAPERAVGSHRLPSPTSGDPARRLPAPTRG
ncbi:tetratricopeptide repeat protein [Streptomyces phaeoluteigriseus]|uniref:Tetratricopeptide repeat protein n=1 Tax=Streptomyces phaeoluteigriseus TaxID=114686 RepID=A0ABY4Z8T6_9ACTN|nr:BTAD domain-containing putative transcriptional regulator [Streptomyces phaeoluteigriseus]USQ85468.1 tetratricopeptide repeat protein [Streptomyces phaeoluteigriseus]